MPSRASVMPPSRIPASTVFVPQAQEAPLNNHAFHVLESLKRQDSGLPEYLAKAAELLNGVVTQLNDRAFEERTRRQERQQKKRRDEQQETEDEKREFEEYQEKVRGITVQLDESIRQLVDDQTWAQEVPQSILHVVTKSRNVRGNQTQPTQGGDQEQEDDEDHPQRTNPPGPENSATALLYAAQSTAEMQWSSKSLTEKYALNNTYSDFYRLKWDAQNARENPPPLPHSSIWFAAEEGRNTQRNMNGTQRGRQTTNDSDDEADEDPTMNDVNDETDLQIASENRSCKCPLTLRYFVEPMTSTKCPHSFEKSAIMELIRVSQDRAPLTPEQEAELNERYPRGSRGRPQAESSMRMYRPQCARCPDAGCNSNLSQNDLRPDPVLLRMTKRAQEAERRAQEADEEDDDDDDDDDDEHDSGGYGLSATQSRRRKVVALGSSPATTVRRTTIVKSEKAVSMVPNSQSQSQSQATTGRSRRDFMDVDDFDDSDDANDD